MNKRFIHVQLLRSYFKNHLLLFLFVFNPFRIFRIKTGFNLCKIPKTPHLRLNKTHLICTQFHNLPEY
jgi:hypothetical protein